MYKIETMCEARCEGWSINEPLTKKLKDVEFPTEQEAQFCLNMMYGVYREIAVLNGEIIDIFKIESNHAALVTKKRVQSIPGMVDIVSVLESVITHV